MVDEKKEGEPSRALVVVNECRDPVRSGVPRPLATFVTQVVACEARVPAFRTRRRAPPPEASTLYGNEAGARQPSRFERVL